MTALTYRPAKLEDAELAADLMTASYPSMAQDPLITRMRWKDARRGFSYGRYIAETEGKPIAYLAWAHGPWEQVEDGHCEVEVWLDRAAIDKDLLMEMFNWIGDQAEAEGPRLLLAYCGEDEPEMLAALAAVDYRPERTEKVWELDLKMHGSRLAAEAAGARDRMKAAGIHSTTLAGWSDPDRVRKLHELDERTINDVPHTVAIVREAFEDFERRIGRPDRPHDRIWVALAWRPARGHVVSEVSPGSRRRLDRLHVHGSGIPRAWHRPRRSSFRRWPRRSSLGCLLSTPTTTRRMRRCFTSMRQLGYRPRPGFVEHHKRVTKKDDA